MMPASFLKWYPCLPEGTEAAKLGGIIFSGRKRSLSTLFQSSLSPRGRGRENMDDLMTTCVTTCSIDASKKSVKKKPDDTSFLFAQHCMPTAHFISEAGTTTPLTVREESTPPNNGAHSPSGQGAVLDLCFSTSF